jgi:two-component system, response regulator PdtaR
MFLSAFSDEATAAKVRSLGAVAYLVKPLDVGKIVPTVGAALAQLRAGGPPPIVEAPVAAPDIAVPHDVVAMAVGVVMHRYSLPRDRAWQRVQRLAQDQGLTVQQQSERLVQAVEELARGALD